MFFGKKKKTETIQWSWDMDAMLLPDTDFKTSCLQYEFIQDLTTVVLGPGYGPQKLVTVDIAEMPHAIIAGGTGSGKSVCVNQILSQLLVKNSPATLRLCFIDPKLVDYSIYKELPHTERWACELDGAVSVLRDLVNEMKKRLATCEKYKVAKIDDLPENIKKEYPRYLLVFDEYGAFMGNTEKKHILPLLKILILQCRAANINCIITTQYPTSQILDNQIKSNCNTKICFKLQNSRQSNTVLDCSGAETLTGNGDGLLLNNRNDLFRFQGVFTGKEQIKHIVKCWNAQGVKTIA